MFKSVKLFFLVLDSFYVFLIFFLASLIVLQHMLKLYLFYKILVQMKIIIHFSIITILHDHIIKEGLMADKTRFSSLFSVAQTRGKLFVYFFDFLFASMKFSVETNLDILSS